MSPLLSSGFVPGFFSWSATCALDEEQPMFGKGWDEFWKLELRYKETASQLCVSKGWGCLAVTAWTAEALWFLRIAGRYHLLWLWVGLFMAWLPFGPGSAEGMQQAAETHLQKSFWLPLVTATQFVQEGEELMCYQWVSSPREECLRLKEIHHLVVMFRVAHVLFLLFIIIHICFYFKAVPFLFLRLWH